MAAIDDILALVKLDGGILIRPEFSDAAGDWRAEVDEIVPAIRIDEKVVAYLAVNGDRVRAQRLTKIAVDGDEWVLSTDDAGVRLVAGPLWLEDQRREVRRVNALGLDVPIAGMEEDFAALHR